MKKIGILTIALIFSSCSFTSYRFDNQKPIIGIDFRTGKWLLNEIECPSSIQEKLVDRSTHDFRTIIGPRFSYRPLLSDLILPSKMFFPLDKSMLKKIKLGSGHDYFINIKAQQIRNDFGSIDLTPARFNNGGENINQVSIEIYDLNTETVIYSQKVIATVDRPNDNQDVNFSKSSASMLIRAYDKLIKDLKSKSVLK
jgi:hypothetical protein